QRHIVEWAPVNDVLDDRVLAVQAMVLRAGAATPLRIVLDDSVASLPAGVMLGRGDKIPHHPFWRGEIPFDQHKRVGTRNEAPRRLGLPLPRRLKVAYPALRFADMLDQLGMFLK